MKKLILILISIFTLGSLLAQAPEKMNYQAVARDLSGLPLVSTTVVLDFEVLEISANGTVVYGETQTTTTNQFGLFTAEIGSGTASTGIFSLINWGANVHYLRITVNGDVMPATQLLSVPYALYSKESGSGSAGLDGLNCWDTNGNGTEDAAEDINGDGIWDALDCKGDTGIAGIDGLGIQWLGTFMSAPVAPSFNDAYYDATLGQSFIWVGTWTLIAQDGISATFVAGNGISIVGNVITSTLDTSSTNELQTLTINAANDTIFLTNGGFVQLPVATSDTDWTQGTGVLYNLNENVGIGTTAPNAKLDVSGYTETDSLRVLAGAGNVGDVLTSDIAGNATWQTASGGGAFSTTGNLTSNAPGDMTTDDFVFGSPQLDYTGTVIEGYRMLFDKSNGAFRAGAAFTTAWDIANRGSFSTAFGRLTMASGQYSFAEGNLANATADGAISMGVSTTASGFNSVALGNNSTASGDNSVAIGSEVNSYSFQETVFGYNSTIYAPGSTISQVGTDRLFVIGNGTTTAARSNALTILKNGDIGIGTASPNAKLDVSGYTETDSLRVLAGAGNVGDVLTSDAAGNATWQTTVLTTGPWTGVGGITELATPGDNVGVGVSPTYKLDVAGDINTNTVYRIDGVTFLDNRSSSTLVGATGNTTFTGTLNTIVGLSAGENMSTASENTFLGNSAGNLNTMGSQNVAIGANSSASNLLGWSNVAVGFNSLNQNTTSGNTALGYRAMQSNTTGIQNAALGLLSLASNVTGNSNTAIGNGALEATLGNNNTGLGYQAGNVNTNGTNNTFIGHDANAGTGLTNLTNATAIGSNATVSASNSLILGNNANVGIGTPAPTTRFHSSGTLRLENLGGAAPAAGAVLTAIDASGNVQWQALAGSSFWNGSTGTVYPNGLTDRVGIGTSSPSTFAQFNVENDGFEETVRFNNTNPSTTAVVTGVWNRIVTNTTLTSTATYGIWNGVNNQSNSTLLTDATFANYSFTNNSGAGDSYGYYYRDFSPNGTSYGIYMDSEDQNYFSGNVGIGTSAPNTQLDVAEDVAFRESVVAINISAISNMTGLADKSFVNFNSATGNFIIYGIADGVDGKILRLYNSTNFNMTLANESTFNTAANRILTMSGVSVSTIGTGVITLQYSENQQRWIVVSIVQ